MTLCDRCHDQPATVFLTRIVHGHMTTENLCEPCADFDPLLAPGGWTPGLLPPQPSPEMLERRLLKGLRAAFPVSPPPHSEPPADLPAEVELPASISLFKLAETLHLQVSQLILPILRQHLRISHALVLDFAAASLVCAHFGVAVRKGP